MVLYHCPFSYIVHFHGHTLTAYAIVSTEWVIGKWELTTITIRRSSHFVKPRLKPKFCCTLESTHTVSSFACEIANQ